MLAHKQEEFVPVEQVWCESVLRAGWAAERLDMGFRHQVPESVHCQPTADRQATPW